MAILITPPFALPSSINFGSTTVVTTYSNPASVWDGYPFKFHCTLTIQIQETSSENTVPPYAYNASDIEVGMWLGLPNGNCYRITAISNINAQGTSCEVDIEDVDLYNLIVDNNSTGNNFPPEGFTGLIFNISNDGLPVITPTEQIRSQLGDLTNWLNDLHDRFRFRNYITDFFSLNPNDTSYVTFAVGDFVKLNSAGQFERVTSTSNFDILSIAGIVTATDVPETGNLRVRPIGRIVQNIPNLEGNIGTVFYFDPNEADNLSPTPPVSGAIYPVYIKINNNTGILLQKGMIPTGGTSGSSGTSGFGTAGTSGSAGTSGQTFGTSGTSASSGSSGTSGDAGSSGTSGQNATAGTSGLNATAGTSGSSGTSSTSGTSGLSGTSATSGSSGTSATSGSSGTSGENATAGTSGENATAGTSGSSGTSASSGSSGTSGKDGSSGAAIANWYGSFSSNQTQVVSGTNAETAWTYNQTEIAYGISISNNTQIKFSYSGQYSIGYSAQIQKTTDTDADVRIWAKVNGIDEPRTSSVVTIRGNLQETLPFVSYIFDLAAEDFVEFFFASSDSTVRIVAFGATSTPYQSPSAPSVIIVAYQVGVAVSGTSGTSGQNGTSGINGSSGTSGINATAGTSGLNATAGTSGQNGSSGTSATSGLSGTSATSGTSGTSASSGTSGENATAGTSGSSGTSGTSGSSGTASTSGTSGTSATSGSSGTASTSGTSGTSGESGSSGTTGTSGSSGTASTSGSSGTSATSGSSGTASTSGTSGTSGESGSSGTTGTSGTSATSGISGSAGTSGVSGVAGGLIYYMNQSINTNSAYGTPTYKQWSSTPSGASQQTITINVASNSTATVQTFSTDTGVPNGEFIPNGTWAFVLHLSLNNSNANFNIYAEVYTYTTGGVSTLIGTTNSVNITYNSGLINQVYVDLFIPYTDTNTSDRIYCKIQATNNINQSHDITFYTEGQTYYSYAQTTFNAPSGTSGTSGVNSTAGTSGISGTSSTSGTSGTSGSSGTSGISGSSGTSGTSGSSGTASTSGTSGTSGESGSSGTSGSSGSSGTSGESGSSGTSGTSGSSGTASTSGTSGTSGESGSSGTSGVGSPGTSGTSGLNATAGTSATSGSSGTSGIGSAGSSGTSGESGSSGTSGVGSSGSSGTSGESGSSGTSGTSGTSQSGAITSLGGLSGASAPSQTFATTTGGTLFQVTSSGSTHTINMPFAGSAQIGIVNASTQVFSGQKQIDQVRILGGASTTSPGFFCSAGFTASSGTGTASFISWTGAINTTSTSTHTVTSINIAQSFTSLTGSYRGIDVVVPASPTGGGSTFCAVFRNATTTIFQVAGTGVITIGDACDIAVNTSTGTKIGTATSQKLGFFNATPVVQQTTGAASATFVQNSGTSVNDASTFGGYTLGQVVTALKNLGFLA